MFQNLIDNLESNQFKNSLAHFEKELRSIKTGRASVSLVEDILIDSYGAKTPLRQLASISIPEARQILIQPWDKGIIQAINKAISEDKTLGLNPNIQGDLIRLNLPALNEENRQNLVKVVNQKAEDARVALRNDREEVWRQIKELKKQGTVTEDEMYSAQNNLNELIEKYNNNIAESTAVKTEEIMTI
ncbi:MAG: hypothetical protein ACD_68C00036G0003 [uncultured bacterium]|nr:MAG: hypothetical protein ACD_68C00036G0003 [uncultured bacterium]